MCSVFGTLLTRSPSQKLGVLLDSFLISLLKAFLLQQLSRTPFTPASLLSFVLCNAANDDFYNAKLTVAPFFLTNTIQLLLITSKMKPKLLSTGIPLCVACQSSSLGITTLVILACCWIQEYNILFYSGDWHGSVLSIFSPLTSPHSKFLKL